MSLIFVKKKEFDQADYCSLQANSDKTILVRIGRCDDLYNSTTYGMNLPEVVN